MVALPAQVILEVSSACNMSCKGCAFHGPNRYVSRPLGVMTEMVWRKAISEVGSWQQAVKLTTHGGGEPLLHPHLKEILTFARSFQKLKIGFLTNGMLLDREWSRFLVSLGLDWISFSIDGVLPGTHQNVRKRSDFHMIQENLNHLIELKGIKGVQRPRILLNMVAYDEVKDQQEAFVEQWINRVDHVMISYYRNPPESKRWPNVPAERKPCPLLWSQMVIAWDGRLGLCCEDFNIDFPIGSVTDRSLIDIWNGEEITGVRKIHELGEFDRHPMCRICDTWADSFIRERLDKVCGYRIRERVSQTVYSAL